MINCLIIEDEPLAADILQEYIAQVPFLKLKGICSDAIFALDVLKKEEIDLIFLDIHLPGLKGLDFLRTLYHPPQVILTTAYHEYALQGYELNVVDYLLKPIAFERFITAVNKVKKTETQTHINETLSIRSDKKTVIIPINEIVYIESQKEYINIQTETRCFKTKYAISLIETELTTHQFIRVHRAFIVALNKIKAFNTQEIEVENATIPIGANYKEMTLAKLKSIYG